MAISTLAPGHHRLTRVLAIGAVAALSASLIVAFPALAKAPSLPTAPSSIDMVGTASYGNPATFTIVDPPTKWIQEMSLTCSVGGSQVYLDVHTEKDANWTTFMLWSQGWQDAGGGPAACTAQLYYYTWQGKTETGLVVEAQKDFVTE